MKKNVILWMLVAALLAGMLAFSAGAETNQYEVGYAKVDINPYWHAWMSWSEGTSYPNAGTYPYQSFYEPYDMMPLPMAGYGSNNSRLSRPKLMDDNGSGVGASRTNVTRAKTSATSGTTTLNKETFYSYVYANNANYQDVHLSSNRYTKVFAQEMGVTYTDGVYGENDGDGVWATCVLVKDSISGQNLLMITVDNISIGSELNRYIRQAIRGRSEIQALGMTDEQILITANHTHGSVDTGCSYDSDDTATTYTLARDTFGDGLTFTEKELFYYLKFYKSYLCNQLAAAAAQAVADLEPALTMEKGAIDAGQQSGHHMNGVRHNVQTYTPTDGSKPSITYVRGSSFNNYMRSSSSYDSHFAGDGFTASQPVSESDDRLQILEFTFANKAPIAMVNFRAHSTANNKEAAKALHYNISADWVSPLRRELEKAGYRFSLMYGNSGNLGTGVSSDSNSLIPYSQAYYSASDGYWVLPATQYGRAIGQAALALLGDVAEKNSAILERMHSVPMGEMLLQKTTYLATRQEFSPLSFAATMKYYLAGSPAAGGRYTINDGETVSYNGKSVTLKTGEGGTYVIASKYHAGSIWARYGVTNKSNLELNTIRLGSQVAMFSTPLEAADRYFTNTIEKTTDILENASKYNDWWNLHDDDTWGVPFDLSLTNGASGYIANELAYDYGKDYTGTDYMIAIGCYEAQNSNHNRGEGEKIVQVLNGMLRNMECKTAYCAHCQQNTTFEPLSMEATVLINNEHVLPSGHYFLAGDFAYTREVKILAEQSVCLDLNSYTYIGESYTECSRAFEVRGTLNVMDLSPEDRMGRVQGLGVKQTLADDLSGGTVNVTSTGTLNLYSGILTQTHRDGYGAANGGVVRVSGAFNMYEGGVIDGKATNGGNIFIDGGTVKIYGGVVERGEATAGGNIYLNDGTLTCMSGGFTGGTATNGGSVYLNKGSMRFGGSAEMNFGAATTNGGNIFVGPEATLQMEGGRISQGRAEKAGKPTASTMGGNIYCNGTFVMVRGDILGGYAYYGGNVQIQGAQASFTMQGGSIYGGTGVYKPDVSDICTGQSSADGGLSQFRLEGGYVETAVYSQGKITLTGGNLYPTETMRVVVKVPGDRLFIEGVYTGNIDLVLNDTNYLGLPVGSKIGNAVNADISGATINLPDYPDYEVAVQGSDLILQKKTLVLVDGAPYGDLEDAVEVYNAGGSQMTLKAHDLVLTGLTRDLHLDLYGRRLAGVEMGSYQLYCKDTFTDDYSSPNYDSYGRIPYGTPYQAEAGYLDITVGEDISFHRYEIAITAVNLRPSNTGIYYTGTLRGDEVVRGQTVSFGMAMGRGAVTDNRQWERLIDSDTENKSHVWYDGYRWGDDVTLTNGVLVSGILKPELSDAENRQRSEEKISGVNYIVLMDGRRIFGNTCSYSLKDVVELLDNSTESINTAALNMYKTYINIMSQWDTDRFARMANKK